MRAYCFVGGSVEIRTPCGRVKKPLLPQAELYATDPKWLTRLVPTQLSSGYQPDAQSRRAPRHWWYWCEVDGI
jgi:hypothetical protein